MEQEWDWHSFQNSLANFNLRACIKTNIHYDLTDLDVSLNLNNEECYCYSFQIASNCVKTTKVLHYHACTGKEGKRTKGNAVILVYM